MEDSNLLCRSFVWMKALLVFATWTYVFLSNNCFWISLDKVFVEKSRTTALVFPTLRANWAIGGYPRRTNIVLKKSISNLFSWNQWLADTYPIFFWKQQKQICYWFKNWDNTEKGSTEKKERNRSWKDNKDTAIRKTFPISRRTVFIWKHLYHDGNVRTSRRQDWHYTKNTF